MHYLLLFFVLKTPIQTALVEFAHLLPLLCIIKKHICMQIQWLDGKFIFSDHTLFNQ